MRKSMWRRHKLSLQTNNSIKKTITITIITVAIAAAPYTTATNKDYIALYITRKDVTHENIPGRSKKSLKPSLKLPTETGLVNLITN
jgi:hypothetical protein